MRAKLSGRTIREAKPQDRPYEIRDTDLKGFLLRVQPSGAKSYVIELGRGKRWTIGNAHVITLEQARVTARAKLAERDAGKLPEPARSKRKPQTLAEFLDNHYAPWVLAEKRSGAATMSNLRAQFEYLYRHRLTDITPLVIEKFKADRLKAGIAPATVNRDLGRIRAVLSKAVEWGALPLHPLRTVKPVRIDDEGRVRYLTADEEERLRAALEQSWRATHIRPLVLLALNTGLRRGELFGLTWGDIDFDRRQLTVRAATAKSQRVRRVPLNSEAVRVLEDWRSSGGATRTGDLVFPSGAGRLTTIKHSWTAVADAAQLTDFRFHDLRHTFASKLVMRGVDLNTVRELLGHSNLKMTLRYAHLAPEHKAAAVESLLL